MPYLFRQVNNLFEQILNFGTFVKINSCFLVHLTV